MAEAPVGVCNTFIMSALTDFIRTSAQCTFLICCAFDSFEAKHCRARTEVDVLVVTVLLFWVIPNGLMSGKCRTLCSVKLRYHFWHVAEFAFTL